MERDVFISYAHEDKSVADAICAKLEETKIRCWIAPRDITPGDKYATALVNAIEASKLVVVVFSHSADKSPHVMTEIERAFNLEKIIIPFRIEDVLPSDEFQYFIGRRHWLDALTPPMEDHISKLVQVTKKILEKSPESIERKESSVSSRGIDPLHNLPVSNRRHQTIIYLGVIIALVVILSLLVVSNTFFHPTANASPPNSSNTENNSINSTSGSSSSNSILTTMAQITSASISADLMLGNWSGYYETSEKGDTNECMYHSNGKMNWNISSIIGDSFSGTTYLTGIERRSGSTCKIMNVLDGTGTIQGKITGNSLEGSYDYSNPTHYGGDYKIKKFTATLSNGKISGMSFKISDGNKTDTFTLTK